MTEKHADTERQLHTKSVAANVPSDVWRERGGKGRPEVLLFSY